MLISLVNNMRNFVFMTTKTCFKNNNVRCSFCNSIFAISKKNKELRVAYIACYNIVAIRIDIFQLKFALFAI
jgi:hypothetical protein